MREGWSCKSAAAVLGIADTKVTQRVDPAVRLVARLMLADPVATFTELRAAMDAERRAIAQRGVELPDLNPCNER